jgi:DNA-binding IclR family transcriptional regulator
MVGLRNVLTDDESKGAGPRGMVGVDRAVAVLEALEGHPGRSLAEVARATHLSDPTALRYLSSLQRHGLVERDTVMGRYSLGIRLFELGQRAVRERDPRQVALPHLRELHARFGETVDLAMRRGDRLILIEALVATHSLGKGAMVGEQDPWHCTSLGKSLLAALPEDEARGILERTPLERRTARTLTDVDMLMLELERIRERGFAIDDEEGEEGLRCVGAAVYDHLGVPSYAMSVSGPEHRFRTSKMTEIGEAVAAAAAAISAQLGYTGEPAAATREASA